MPPILKPISQPTDLGPFTENLEYRIERGGDVYVAGAKNAYFNFYGTEFSCRIYADLYLDRLDGTETSRLWKPRMTNPFHIEVKKVDKRIPEFYIEDVIIDISSFENFIKWINYKLGYKYGKEIGTKDAEIFLSGIYSHYNGTPPRRPKKIIEILLDYIKIKL